MSYKGHYVEKNEYKCSIMNEVERYADLNRERQDSYKSSLKVGWKGCGGWLVGVQQIQFALNKVEMGCNNLILSMKKTKRVFQFQSGLLILAHKF